MATRRYSIARGAGMTDSQVTEAVGAATATASMEFTFDLAAGLTREDIVKGIALIKARILKGSWPPA